MHSTQDSGCGSQANQYHALNTCDYLHARSLDPLGYKDNQAFQCGKEVLSQQEFEDIAEIQKEHLE